MKKYNIDAQESQVTIKITVDEKSLNIYLSVKTVFNESIKIFDTKTTRLNY